MKQIITLLVWAAAAAAPAVYAQSAAVPGTQSPADTVRAEAGLRMLREALPGLYSEAVVAVSSDGISSAPRSLRDALPGLYGDVLPDRSEPDVQGIADALAGEGFANVRVAQTRDYAVFTVENDRYKLAGEGLGAATRLISEGMGDSGRPVKLIATDCSIPELTITYNPADGRWSSTKRLDSSWDAVRGRSKLNSSWLKTDITIYPQLALKNLIINQVYQSLWLINPALEVTLWPGARFAYQVQIPVYNDGYGSTEKKVHPGLVTFSQRFRDPWHLNVFGKATVGQFSGNRYGAALELAYYFPNERFWLDTQLGYLGFSYFYGWKWRYARDYSFRWNVAANYYCPPMQSQFTLRCQQFINGDTGVKFEAIRHLKYCSIGVYALKGKGIKTNGGFRFQIALPPYRMRRHGYIPRVTTSANMGMAYNAGNEQVYYKEWRTEASDNIMSKNAYNSYYVNLYL